MLLNICYNLKISNDFRNFELINCQVLHSKICNSVGNNKERGKMLKIQAHQVKWKPGKFFKNEDFICDAEVIFMLIK